MLILVIPNLLYMLLVRIAYFLIMVWSPLYLIGQSSHPFLEGKMNIPEIVHFSTKDFQADPQFWTMCTDLKGIRYFGNNDGVLVYDGERWQKVLLPNSSAVRSLHYAEDGRVFAGGYNEFGLIKQDAYGAYYFETLLDKITLQNRPIENVWQIHQSNTFLIFRTFNGLIVYQNGLSTYVSAPQKFEYAAVVDAQYYVYDSREGVLTYDNNTGKLSTIFSIEEIEGDEKVVAMLPSKKEDIIEIVTEKGSVYEGNIVTKTLVRKPSFPDKGFQETVLAAVKNEETYLFGTLGAKVVMLSEDGTILELPQALKDVQDATVLGIHKEEAGYWLLLNNGLDFITYESKGGRKLFEGASVYDIVLDSTSMTLATNKGLYNSFNAEKIENKRPISFDLVKGTEGQVWSLNKFEDVLLINHDKGLLSYADNKLEVIGTPTGIWKTIPIPGKQNKFLACGYTGLFLVEKEGARFTIIRKLEGFNESSRDIIPAYQEDTYWVCHGYKGIFKIKITPDYDRVYAVDHYTDQNGLPSYLNINVHHWDSNIVFSTNKGIYRYDAKENQFTPVDTLNALLGTTTNTRKIVQRANTTWLVQNDELAYLASDWESGPPINEYFLQVKGQLNRGMESIYPIGDKQVLVGAKTGLYYYDLEDITTANPTSHITQIRSQGDDNKEIKIALSNTHTDIDKGKHSLTFQFTLLEAGVNKNVRYSYQLDGLQEKWSPWTSLASKEYSLLPPGDYTFMVRGRNDTGAVGSIDTFNFTILPFWYQSKLAILLYIIVLIVTAWLLYRLMMHKVNVEKSAMIEHTERSRRLLELEKAQLKFIEDTSILQEDMLSKSKKLANYTIQLVNKKQVFTELKNDLRDLRALATNSQSKSKISQIFQKLNKHKIGEEYVQLFDTQFEEVHHVFFSKLRAMDPHLSKRDLRLAAFVKMNLANKEIAPLLNISVRGVETARYRLSKKLLIPENLTLSDFLTNL